MAGDPAGMQWDKGLEQPAADGGDVPLDSVGHLLVSVFGWLASELLFLAAHELNPETVRRLEQATLSELSEFWRDANSRTGPCWDAFRQLSPQTQARLAGGFQLIARKR